MRNLRKYVERQNVLNRLFGTNEITFPLSSKDSDDIAYSLEGDLSPENLHCDGEISRAEAQRKYDFYMKVQDELEEHTGTVRELEY